MTWFFKFMNSSIGKKILMALTGFLLCGFLITHLLGNLLLFVGEEAFNDYVYNLKSLGILLKVAELGLAGLFLAHIVNGIKLSLENKDSKFIENDINDAAANSGGGSGGTQTNDSGNGGSGVVILKLPTANYVGVVTGSPTVTTSGSNTIVKFTEIKQTKTKGPKIGEPN